MAFFVGHIKTLGWSDSDIFVADSQAVVGSDGSSAGAKLHVQSETSGTKTPQR